ncbi:MAG TPA: ABC transporter permease [Nitrospiraceae bacterium]|jgi:spermidine/putrescine transport system permease protein|nr:ABC transporter permease [Nitrospiraceae bacterium]
MAGGSRRWLAAGSLAVLLLLYLPVAVLIVFSFNASRFSAVWQGFTLQWYRALAVDESLLAALQNSLIVASVSTVFATVLGLGVALGVHRRAASDRDGIAGLLEGALLLPLVIPEVMMGVALLLFFVLIKLPLGLLTIMLGHITFNLPVVVIIVLARLRKLDPALEEAAWDLGATRWQAFRGVTLPLLMPALVGGMLMAFTISLDDFIVTFFTAGPGSTTLPLKVYSMLKSGFSPVINALSTILVLVSMGLLGFALFFQRETVRQK